MCKRQYNDIAAAAYSVTSVGGSPACTSAIAAGHAKIGTMMKNSEGRTSLGKTFGLGPAFAAGYCVCLWAGYCVCLWAGSRFFVHL